MEAKEGHKDHDRNRTKELHRERIDKENTDFGRK